MPDTLTVAKASLHFWEEPCISGKNGSGTVFFSGCSLKCVFCQNCKISHGGFGKEISVERLVEIFEELKEHGANNINLVSPTHFIPQIKQALIEFGGKLPIVYNSSGYEKTSSLRELDGLVDIYLPDLKYISPVKAERYSKAGDYFDYASKAILEMQRQVGSPVFGDDGLMKKGIIIRHMILPQNTNESIKILEWIKQNMPPETYISLMCQYTPCGDLSGCPEIDRKITVREYDKVIEKMFDLGLTNGFVQDISSAQTIYIPDFDLSGV